jgi:uncharacterized protein YjdB
MKRWIGTIGIVAIVAACSGLPASDNGVVALVVTTPDSLNLTVGDSLTLQAHAENLQGETVPADIEWRTSDPTLVTVDAGVVTALVDTAASAHVQATVGALVSNIVIITLRDSATTTTAGLRARP